MSTSETIFILAILIIILIGLVAALPDMIIRYKDWRTNLRTAWKNLKEES